MFHKKTRSHFLLLATILLKFATRRDCFTRYRKEHISTQITQKELNYSARDSELGTICFLFDNKGPFCSVSTSARFNVIVGNTFLGTIVPKPSIKNQFVPLEIDNSEQLVFSLTKKDHCVPSPYESNVIEGNAFLQTIVPKSFIKDQFVPLPIHK